MIAGLIISIAVLGIFLAWLCDTEYDGPDEPWNVDWDWPEWEDFESE